MKKLLICVTVLICLILAGIFIIPALFVEMYRPNGEVANVFSLSVQNHKEDGWYERPVMKVFAPGGKSEVIYTTDIDKYKKDGWYEKPVTRVYKPDGKSEVIYISDVKVKTDNGWYTEPVVVMNKGKEEKNVVLSKTEECRSDGWFFKEYYKGLGKLGEKIKEYTEKRAGEFGVYIKNLNTDEVLVLNDKSYASASIVKLFQMAGIYSEIEKGNLEKDKNIQRYLELLITESDNVASNRLVSILGDGDYRKGFEIVDKHTKSIGCINTQHRSLFIVDGFYIAYGSNLASPYDCGIILEKIYKGELVSKKCSEEMLSLLKRQTRQNKIPYYLPEDIVCANKTGETDNVQSDVGIVFSPECDYIICVLTNNAPSGIEDIRQISKMTYEYFNKTKLQ